MPTAQDWLKGGAEFGKWKIGGGEGGQSRPFSVRFFTDRFGDAFRRPIKTVEISASIIKFT